MAESTLGSNISWFTNYSKPGTALNKNQTLTYEDTGWLQGEYYEDDVEVDDFVANDVQLLSVTPDSKSSQEAFDGAIGMSYTPKSSSGVAGFFERLIDQKAVTAPEFSVLFTRNQSQKGHLVLGGREPTKYKGNFTTAPVVQTGGWYIKVDGYSVNGKRLIVNGTLGLLLRYPTSL